MTTPFIPPDQFRNMAINAVFQGLKQGPNDNGNATVNKLLPYILGGIVMQMGKTCFGVDDIGGNFNPPTGGCGPVPKVPPVPRV